jgi:hypothetical protein
MENTITVKNARLHNLKNVTVSIPKNKLIVFTGVSGSGKSTLAFDILHKEGQRQYMESLGLVTHGLTKPPIESIVGLSPSISIDQHVTNHNPRSTVVQHGVPPAGSVGRLGCRLPSMQSYGAPACRYDRSMESWDADRWVRMAESPRSTAGTATTLDIILSWE